MNIKKTSLFLSTLLLVSAFSATFVVKSNKGMDKLEKIAKEMKKEMDDITKKAKQLEEIKFKTVKDPIVKLKDMLNQIKKEMKDINDKAKLLEDAAIEFQTAK